MKKYLLIALGAMLVTVTSCKKDDPTNPDPAYVGLWKGKYGNISGGVNQYPNNGYAMLLRNNGTIRVFNSVDTATASKAEGTYTISGSSFTTTYTYIAPGSGTYSTTATLDAKFNFMEGTWGNGTNNTNGGAYFLVRQ